MGYPRHAYHTTGKTDLTAIRAQTIRRTKEDDSSGVIHFHPHGAECSIFSTKDHERYLKGELIGPKVEAK